VVKTQGHVTVTGKLIMAYQQRVKPRLRLAPLNLNLIEKKEWIIFLIK
jgi:hypothetical protein